MKKIFTYSGFTLLELIIVVIIIGILAGFAVPNYLKNIQMAKQKTVRSMLLLMRDGQSVYRTANQDYYPLTSGIFADITAINQDLGLSILQPADIYYECERTGSPDFTCHGYHPQKAGYKWHIAITSTTDPACDPATACF